MTIHEIPLIVSSDEAVGAINKSADGSQFEVQLDDPISIPASAQNCVLEIQESSIWWVIPNIITGINDQFRMDDGVNGFVQVTIPQGLYDLSGLQNSCETLVVNAGQNSGSFTFVSDEATQKVIIRLNVINAAIDFTIVNSFRDIVGFNSQVITATFASESFIADSVAAFNQIDFFLIHTDLVDKGIRFNNTYSQVASQVLIEVPPGSQNLNSPRWPTKVPAWNLIGSIIKNFRMWLTDQANRPVNTSGENWSARIIIKYST